MSTAADAMTLATAAFAGGTLNAVAGGGSFLTLPALLAAGVPPVAANASGTMALLPGYFSAAASARRALKTPPGLGGWTLSLLALAGGITGALLLLWTGDRRFAGLAPLLLLAATALFALAPRLRPAPWPTAAGAGLLFAVCVYGGYFNGGLGILLLAALGALGLPDLQAANALKNLLSGLLTTIAVLVYAAGDAIAWGWALWMLPFGAAGGFAGARLAGRLPPRRLRGFIVVTGLAMTVLIARRL